MNRRIFLIIAILAIFIGAFIILRRPAIAPQESASPTSSPAQSTSSTSGNIIISSPRKNDMITDTVRLIGKARVFESAFAYRLTDDTGAILFEGHDTAHAPDVGQFGDFSVTIAVPATASQNLLLEVFSRSAKDGSIINLVSVPLRHSK